MLKDLCSVKKICSCAALVHTKKKCWRFFNIPLKHLWICRKLSPLTITSNTALLIIINNIININRTHYSVWSIKLLCHQNHAWKYRLSTWEEKPKQNIDFCSLQGRPTLYLVFLTLSSMSVTWPISSALSLPFKTSFQIMQLRKYSLFLLFNTLFNVCMVLLAHMCSNNREAAEKII